MTPTTFPEANATFRPPTDLEESQCRTIHAWQGTIERGSCEGVPLTVTAWKPSETELAELNAGKPIFLSCLGGLPPHFLTTDFVSATNPA